MNLVVCPHCNSHKIVTARLPKDAVAMTPCPGCSEWVVLFRKKVIAIDRRILAEGSMEERRDHIASVIAEFLDPDMFRRLLAGQEEGGRGINIEAALSDVDADDTESSPEWQSPITDREQDHFARIQLQRLDDSIYFKRHFG